VHPGLKGSLVPCCASVLLCFCTRPILNMRGYLFLLAPLVGAALVRPRSQLDDCPGYSASNVKQLGQTLTADLDLAGDACNTYGTDLPRLKLLVEAQNGISQHPVHYQV
jgi:alpha-glucosidase